MKYDVVGLDINIDHDLTNAVGIFSSRIEKNAAMCAMVI